MATKPTTKEARLHELEPFRALRPKELATLSRLSTEVQVQTGHELMSQGHHARECFVIEEGKAAVIIDGVTVTHLGPGEVVGEVALFDKGTRTASVVADTPMRVFAFSATEFHSVIDALPTVSQKITAKMAERLRTVDARLSNSDS